MNTLPKSHENVASDKPSARIRVHYYDDYDCDNDDDYYHSTSTTFLPLSHQKSQHQAQEEMRVPVKGAELHVFVLW